MSQKSQADRIHSFYETYSKDIECSLKSMSKVELLDYLGSYTGGDRNDPGNYVPSDIFIGVASAISGISEHEIFIYSLTYFGHTEIDGGGA